MTLAFMERCHLCDADLPSPLDLASKYRDADVEATRYALNEFGYLRKRFIELIVQLEGECLECFEKRTKAHRSTTDAQ